MKKIILILIFVLILPSAFAILATDGVNNFEFTLDTLSTTNDEFKTSNGIIATDGDNILYLNMFYEDSPNQVPTLYSTRLLQNNIVNTRCRQNSDCVIEFIVSDDICLNDKSVSMSVVNEIDEQIYFNSSLVISSNDGNLCNYTTESFIPQSVGFFNFNLTYVDEELNSLNYNESFEVVEFDYGVVSSSNTGNIPVIKEVINDTVVNDTIIEKEIFVDNLSFLDKTLIEIPLSKISLIDERLNDKFIRLNFLTIVIIVFIILLLVLIRLLKNE